MTTTATAPRLALDVPEADYHAGPELSSTGAKTILASPARYAWDREHPTHRDVFDVGHAAHALILGTPLDVAVVDAPDWRGKPAREAKAAAYEAGQVPLLASTWAEVREIAEAVLAHPTARTVLEREGVSEASAYWTDEATGVPCRARFDRLTTTDDGRALCVDVKTTADASPRGFAGSVAKFGYPQQDAWYCEALTVLGHDDPAFVFLAVEKVRPYLVGMYELREPDRQIGREKNALARQVWRDCTASGVWPGYADGIEFLDLPKWYGYQHQEDTW